MGLCYKITLDNICATKGWGAIATHWCTDVTMRNCHVGRADYHYGVYGVNVVENCSFISYPCKIEIGYGDGTVIVRDSIFYKRIEGSIYSNDFIQCRNDFAIMFSGKLIFDNVTVQLFDYDPSRNNYSWLLTYRTGDYNNELLEWAPNNFPYVSINNLLVRAENTADVDKLQLIGIYSSYTGENVRHMSIG